MGKWVSCRLACGWRTTRCRMWSSLRRPCSRALCRARWNPVSLLFLVPAWSYHVSGPADHWWFVARSANNMYFYAAQFCMDESGKNHVSGCVYLGLCAAVASGLQYPEAQWWFAREWAPCRKPRSKKELDRLLLNNPSAMLPYSWMDNNCQHFAVNLYEGDPGHIA
ncbi:unnamed protein product [Effrenium voratum]|uniref:LRAT domain-containing protein n=1 Tax=Effrenium voratum TaxID=2562239 RepID=A0AA36JFV9_9DINO|nr:unnamed protein product [Effrenium voratum]CAJ1404311.1 unnamed protein product [Effrenium voratum]